MATLTTDQFYPSIVLTIVDKRGRPAKVQEGSIVWASSDPTVITVTPSADGMSAQADTVAPSQVDASGNPHPSRFTVTADADLGDGVVEITGVSEDITVTAGLPGNAAAVTLALGAPADKP